VLRLKGGDDWQRKLEDALRHRACKLLLVANPTSVDRQGVRNEIQIASEVARKLKDQAFIIPLRLAPFQAPFLIAQAQYIDFQRGWARGLAELLDTLEQTYKLPRAAIDGSSIWRDIHLIHTKETVAAPERLISNWLAINEAPEEAAAVCLGYTAKRSRSSAYDASALEALCAWREARRRRAGRTLARAPAPTGRRGKLRGRLSGSLELRSDRESRASGEVRSSWIRVRRLRLSGHGAVAIGRAKGYEILSVSRT